MSSIKKISVKNTKIIKTLIFFILYFLVNPLLADNKSISSCLNKHPNPVEISQWTVNKDKRKGSFYFTTQAGLKLKAYYYRPTTFNENSLISFVMHGAARNADDYLDTFAPVAERNNSFAIAPEFSKNYFPTSGSYTLGVGKYKVPYSKTYSKKRWKDRSEFLYQEIERIFEAIKIKLSSNSCGYYMFGHSAGGQYIHRHNTFLPNARIIRATAVNAGWYTLPSWGSPDKQSWWNNNEKNYYMAYGLQGSPVSELELKKSFNKKLTILAGEKDIKTSDQSRMVYGSKQAQYQGENRLQRASFYYKTAQETAKKLNYNLAWQFNIIPKATHSKHKTVQSAAWYLFKQKQFKQKSKNPCRSSDINRAVDIEITEIHADPAKGSKGDANNDGVRDSNDDEFIEIVNNGNKAICLAGWTIADQDKRRHVFPIGTELMPGKYLVVFGGGIPTGKFSDAIVQWASYSDRLNLNNKGDAINIFHSDGELVQSISWGNCGNKKCSKQHIPYSLNFNESIVKNNKGLWKKHTNFSKQRFSPGKANN